jgi:hypothetical protein
MYTRGQSTSNVAFLGVKTGNVFTETPSLHNLVFLMAHARGSVLQSRVSKWVTSYCYELQGI